MLCLPVTSSYEGCPASYWWLTVSQDDHKAEVVGQISRCSAVQALVNQVKAGMY